MNQSNSTAQSQELYQHTLTIAVEENGTTGYIWELSKSSSDTLTMKDEGYVSIMGNVPPESIPPGTGSIRTIRLISTSRNYNAILKLRRPWLPENEAIKTLTITMSDD